MAKTETIVEILEDKKSAKLMTVKLTQDINFFNISGKQLSAARENGGMAGVHLTWNGDVVVVTHDGFPGEEKWIFPASIAFASWSTS